MRRDAKLLGLAGLVISLGIASYGCGSDDDGNGTETGAATGTGGTGGAGGTGTGTGTAGGGGTGGGSGVCSPEAVPCETEVTSELDLQAEVAPGNIGDAADGTGWMSTIDATAGGPFAPDPHSYVYGKFSDTGLTKVLISDEESLDSQAWDIAFRRYLIRINSGHSGPSCVSRARVAGTPDYDSITSLPSGLTYQEDEYFSASCALIEDGSGLGSPATALSGFWTYSQDHCLQMSGNVYILQLADGRHVKLTVTHYYSPDAAQEQCNTDGTLPTNPEPVSAIIKIRWAFVE